MVKRYDPMMCAGIGIGKMEEDEVGEYVPHDEYIALAERCTKLEAALSDVVSDCRLGADKYGMSEYGINAIIRRLESTLSGSSGGKDG